VWQIFFDQCHAKETENLTIQKYPIQYNNLKKIFKGLANLFHGNDLLKLTQMNKNDFDSMKVSIAEALHLYIGELGKDIHRVTGDWNGPSDAHISALVSSFATFVKRFNLPVKQIGKVDLDKIPTFVNKKPKLKKSSSNSTRGHSFIDCSFLNPKLVCAKCGYSFWGIGFQGIICQSKLFSKNVV
jgi:hypothetical protein